MCFSSLENRKAQLKRELSFSSNLIVVLVKYKYLSFLISEVFDILKTKFSFSKKHISVCEKDTRAVALCSLGT